MDKEADEFIQSCAKELAARLLAKVIKRTPVGEYDKPVKFTTKDGVDVQFTSKSGKKGGTLRRGWTTQKGAGSEGLKTSSAPQYVDTLKINHFGDTYIIDIINPIEYASYVEYGHRTPSRKGWVKGKFMLTISEQEIEQITPKVLEQKITRFMRNFK